MIRRTTGKSWSISARRPSKPGDRSAVRATSSDCRIPPAFPTTDILAGTRATACPFFTPIAPFPRRSSMKPMVRPGVGHACIDGRFLFLDVDRDRYSAAGAEASRLLSRLAAGGMLAPCEWGPLAPLLEAGLIVEAAEDGPGAPPPGARTHEGGEVPSDGLSPLARLPLALWHIAMARRR